jgi:hypothetical protein
VPPKNKGRYLGDDRERVRAIEQWRAAWIGRFAERQRCTRKWINFGEIADWCSKEDQSIVPSKEKRATAFDTLASDLLAGEFEENGRSLVLYLHAAIGAKRMTRRWLQDVIEHDYEGHRGRSQYLPHCWMPRRVFERWLAKHRLERSPARFQPRGAERAIKKVTQGAKTKGILEAINRLWPHGIPKGLSGKERNNAIRAQLEKSHASIPQDLPRVVQRALKAHRSK